MIDFMVFRFSKRKTFAMDKNTESFQKKNTRKLAVTKTIQQHNQQRTTFPYFSGVRCCPLLT